MSARHVATIKHDAESHQYDCHDDCTVTLTCPGVTDACRTWWECNTCREAREGMDDDALDEHYELLYKDGAHGEDHSRIDGMWMTPSAADCITAMLDTDADELVETLADGEHLVDLECDEGFVHVMAIEATP